MIPVDFAESIKSMAGLRNILVHEYTEVNMKKLTDVLNNSLDDFSKFATFVMNFLENSE